MRPGEHALELEPLDLALDGVGVLRRLGARGLVARLVGELLQRLRVVERAAARSNAPVTASSCAFSFRSAWAFALSDQKSGSSESRAISATRERFRSTSKRPPERLEAARQLCDALLGRYPP